MAKPFHELREHLLRAGVAPRHVRRYLSELADHLADLTAEEERAGHGRADAESAALTRLGGMDHLANAMTRQRQFQSWCVRAPWATFGLAPVFALGAAWFVACFILWCGWRAFLPGSITPFVPKKGFPIYYFGVGRLLYYTAPILVGWGFGLVASRQRSPALWPIFGLVPIALFGATVRVYVGHPGAAGAPGHIYMAFTLGSSIQSIYVQLLYASVILLVAVAPYLLWRLRKAYLPSA